MTPRDQLTVIVEPKWKGRNKVKRVIRLLATGSLLLTLHQTITPVFDADGVKQGWAVGRRLVQRDTANDTRDVMVLSTVVFVTSGTTWTVPADCNLCDVECIGGGGSGSRQTNSGGNVTGGSGAAWAKATGVTVTPNGSVTIQVGAGGASVTGTTAGPVNGNVGTDTWWNGATLALSKCGAKAGLAGKSAAAGGAVTGPVGGAEASCIGGVGGGTLNPGTSFARSGGAGGSIGSGHTTICTGGGGAGGSTGNGTSAPTNSTATSASDGGSGDAGVGGAAGVAALNTSLPGGDGTEYQVSPARGSGGGAGASVSSANATAGAGGNFGAGGAGAGTTGAGATTTSGAGAPGLIVVTYTPTVGPLTEFPLVFPFIRETAPQSQIARNASLFTAVPFAQTDWSVQRRVADFLPAAHQPTNINLYTNPIPFAQFDWTQSRRALDFLPSAQFYNTNLYGVITAAPFAQYDWSGPRRTPDVLPPSHQPTNTNLFTNSIPFAQYSWTPTLNIPGLPPQRLPYNINIYTAVGTEVLRAPVLGNQKSPPVAFQSKYLGTPVTLLVDLTVAPFAQLDWPSAKRTPDVLVSTPSYNTNIFSEVPFTQLAWGPTARAPFASFTQPYNLTIFGDLQGPFNQFIWLTSKVSRSSTSDVSQRNVNIFSEVPFYKSDWSTAAVIRLTAPIPTSYNTGLYATVPAPFIPIDWSRPFKALPVPAGMPPLNINLFTNPIPFSQSDWSATSRQKPPTANLQPLNTNLYGVIVVTPFNQLDWSTPRQVARAPVDLTRVLNLNIYTNPIPFAQYSWAVPSAHVNAPYFVIQDFMLLVSVSPASETPHIVKFIGNVGHLMLR